MNLKIQNLWDAPSVMLEEENIYVESLILEKKRTLNIK